MAPASPGIDDTTTAFLLAFTCRWSLFLSRSAAESSVEVPCSIRWSHGFQVFQGLTSGSSKPVKAEEGDQGWVYAIVKGWFRLLPKPPFSNAEIPFQLSFYHSCKLRPPSKLPFITADIPFYPPCAKDCSFSMEKAPFRLERMCCLKFGSWMTRPIPLNGIGACLPCELSPRSFFKCKMHDFKPVFYQLFKIMYESMRMKVEHVVGIGKVGDEYITSDEDRRAFSKWNSDGFSRQNHPAVIQVVLDKNRDKDITGHCLPNLVYVSRQKSTTSPHHFKAGALNVLVRVSAAMTNAPVILTLDCDMYSNDPRTPLRALCYVLDPEMQKNLAYVQFPQEFHGLNDNDIYACEHKRLFKVHPVGFDGLSGPNYVGTGCFFRRRALFGDPSTMVSPETKDLGPDHVVNQPITAPSVLELAHHVAGCNYESHTKWGSKIGFRYGSLVEDYYTGYRLKCEGWRSLFCYPEKPAFLGDVPFNFVDVLGQNKRWAIGLLEVGLSRYSTITYGVKAMGLLMGLAYSYYAFWPVYAIPITTYSFLPQLALLNGISIFPKVSEPWFLLYMFLFLGAYGQDLLEFVIHGGTVQRWWSDQRMWMMRGLSCYLFGVTEFFLKSIGIPTQGFNVTSKVIDDEQSKRYEQGFFEFGVPSSLFVALAMAAMINLSSFIMGLINFLNASNKEGLEMQLVLTGSIVMNCLPIYQAMVLRSDKGKMPFKTTITAAILASTIYVVASPFTK